MFAKVFRFAQGNFGKRHKKALGRALKSGAEGVGLKLLKESTIGIIINLLTIIRKKNSFFFVAIIFIRIFAPILLNI